MTEHLRWKIEGSWKRDKPCYTLLVCKDMSTNPRKGFVPVGDQKVNSTLKELKLLMLELWPDFRIYTKYRSNGREFYGFTPMDPKDRGFTEYPKSNHKLNRRTEK